MRLPSRMLAVAALLQTALWIGTAAKADAQDPHAGMTMPATQPAPAVKIAMRVSRWSDPAAWPAGHMPRAGEAVTIARDRSIVLDVNPPALRSLTIEGKLTFAPDRDLNLTTDWIYLPGGELEIGTESSPYSRNASITLTDTVPGENINTMGDRGIMLLGGTLSLHGNRGGNTWTKLTHTAKAGSATIEVMSAAGWRKGDTIVLASTDYDPRQAEKRTITAIRGNALTLDTPLRYMHFGAVTYGVDERGEVGLLSRNITIQASDDAERTYLGGHIMAMGRSTMQVDGVELSRMGQHLALARYPIHFHVLGDGAGMYVRNAAIHDTYNRCVTVHGTNDLRVENNVTYNTVGHCFFLEDGIEHGNQFVHNLAVQTKCHPTLPCVPTNLAANGERDPRYTERAALQKASFRSGNTLLPSDNTVASFWITNPDNSFVDNVAAGSDQVGFWLSLPEHPQGAFKDADISKAIWPRRTPLRAFQGNVAHSNFDGFLFDRNIYEDNTFGLATIPFLPLKNPADLESDVVETHFDNLTSYKNRNGGLWSRGDLYVFSDAKFADNAIGMTSSAGDIGSQRFKSRLVGSLIVGESDNIGNPATPEEVAYGRSLPKTKIPDFPIRGYEYYDYRDDVVDTRFVNFQDNARRKTGALSFLLYTSAGVSTGSTIRGAKFVNAKPVYFPNIDPRFDNDNRGGAGYRTASFHDLDGSVTGIPDSHVMLNDGENDSVATDASCVIHPTWNASVCRGDIGRLNLSDSRGELPGTVDLESRTARFALLASLQPSAPDTPLVKAQRAALFSRRAPQAPIALVRNGREFRITGDQSTVRAGTEITVKTERTQVTLSLAEMDQGSWVMLELPGFSKAASGKEQVSLDALRAAKETAFFRGPGALWVKLVAAAPVSPIIRPTDLQASIAVSR